MCGYSQWFGNAHIIHTKLIMLITSLLLRSHISIYMVYKVIHHQNPWNASWGSWRLFFKLYIRVSMAFTFQGWSSVSWKRETFRVTKHQQNDKKYLKILKTYPWSELTDPLEIGYGACLEILAENVNVCFIVLHFHEVCSMTHEKWSEVATHKCVSWATREG